MNNGLVIVDCLKIGLHDLSKIEDPVLRYNTFIQLLSTVANVGIMGFKRKLNSELIELSYNDDGDYDDNDENHNKKKIFMKNLKIKNTREMLDSIDDVYTELNKYFDGFKKYIQSPVYSPDNCYGNIMMQMAKEEFKTSQ